MEYALIFLALIVATGFALVFHKLSEKPKPPDVNVTVHVPTPEMKFINGSPSTPYYTDKVMEPSFKVDPIEYMNRTKVEESHINVESNKLDK